jgi:hypothetical protein
MTRLNAAWTDEHNERLKVLVAQQVSIARASVIFRKSINAVRNQARKLGTPFPTIHEVRKRSSGARPANRI